MTLWTSNTSKHDRSSPRRAGLYSCDVYQRHLLWQCCGLWILLYVRWSDPLKSEPNGLGGGPSATRQICLPPSWGAQLTLRAPVRVGSVTFSCTQGSVSFCTCCISTFAYRRNAASGGGIGIRHAVQRGVAWSWVVRSQYTELHPLYALVQVLVQRMWFGPISERTAGAVAIATLLAVRLLLWKTQLLTLLSLCFSLVGSFHPPDVKLNSSFIT